MRCKNHSGDSQHIKKRHKNVVYSGMLDSVNPYVYDHSEVHSFRNYPFECLSCLCPMLFNLQFPVQRYRRKLELFTSNSQPAFSVGLQT
jgi:hypothetical protein